MTKVTAQKWGNSLGIRIPKEAADRVGIKQGVEMDLEITKNETAITLKPKNVQKKYKLEELINQITDKNKHDEVDFGTEGRELI